MQKIDSRIISFLRFPMIVGIVLIHSGLEVKDMAQAPVYDYLVVRGIIGTFTRVCVPLFFIISGYLFFAHLERFGREEYLYKLRRRGRSLLEPYLFYNGLAVCLFAVLGLVKPELQGGTTPPVSQWTPAVVASLFWDYGNNLPIVPQFWFIRNLMCIVVATPLIYWLVRTTKGAVVILLAALWGGQIWEFGIPGTMGLFFFTLGAYFSICSVSIYQTARKLRFLGYTYPLWAFADITTKGEGYNVQVHDACILVGIILVVSLLGRWLERRPDASPNKFLLASTFFVFAMHEPYMGKYTQVVLRLLPAISDNAALADIQYVVYYFVNSFLWIAILLGVFAAVRRVSPKLAAFLSGGR